jgi:hypothetical protein
MGLITKIKELFSEDESIQKTEAETIDVKFVDVKTVDGMILRVSDLAVDATVVEINESGEVPVSDGEYTLEDGTMISVAGGIITGITPVSVSEQMANVMRTDGVAIYYDGTDLVVGETKLFLDEALTEPAPDGEHLLEGGIKVTVTNGVLTEMVESDDVEEDLEETFVEETVTEEKDVQGVVNNLKELISQVKDLKSQFELIQNENIELKQRIEKFASAPSAEPTKTKVDFKKVDRAEKLEFFGRK